MNLSKTLLATALTVPLALTGCGGPSDGHNNDSGQQYQFNGAVQKGPLQPGSVVTINELNQDLQPLVAATQLKSKIMKVTTA
ncbi:hypothetical protein [Vibrio harveyi]|uniref:hypothetical protein n=1 Tax=Vibrio harveyi TaxID=669 RepID=UPI00217D4563|nr:hypothetical protein [Vibrio harveyi]